jgi:hypothetical protein
MTMRSPDRPGAVSVDARRDGVAARRAAVLSGWEEARAVAFFAVAFLAVAFFAVAFVAVAFFAVAFVAVAFFAVAFFAVAFFAGTVHSPLIGRPLVSLITSFKDTSGKRQFKGALGLFARGGDGRSSPQALISSDG